MLRSDWLGCRGVLPRLLRFLHRHGCRPATRYALRKCDEARAEALRLAVAERCWATGKVVIGHVDEEGNFAMQEVEP